MSVQREDSAALPTVNRVDAVRSQVAAWRDSGRRIAFVPTMGNLHEGHMSLIRLALARADLVVASIFVNPLQFGPEEDYQEYPRTLDEDSAMLAAAGVHLLFAPSVEEVYPDGETDTTRVVVPGVSDILCGVHRPGHFAGMATVVCKLINMVVPDIAVFGEKDFQQLMIIRRLVRDLWMPVEIGAAPTWREPDGLAMSSRNRYLTAEQRQRAPAVFRSLTEAAARLSEGRRDFAALAEAGRAALEEAGLKTNYFEIRRAADLGEPRPDTQRFVVLAAAWLGKARLIDNVVVEPAQRPV